MDALRLSGATGTIAPRPVEESQDKEVVFMVRAKFVCRSVTDYGAQADVEFYAVYDGSEENKRFWQATPAGNIKLSIVNKAAADQFQPGKQYYIDLTPAD